MWDFFSYNGGGAVHAATHTPIPIPTHTLTCHIEIHPPISLQIPHTYTDKPTYTPYIYIYTYRYLLHIQIPPTYTDTPTDTPTNTYIPTVSPTDTPTNTPYTFRYHLQIQIHLQLHIQLFILPTYTYTPTTAAYIIHLHLPKKWANLTPPELRWLGWAVLATLLWWEATHPSPVGCVKNVIISYLAIPSTQGVPLDKALVQQTVNSYKIHLKP